MIEFLLLLKALLTSPFVWFLLFMSTAVLQFYLAQRLHHHQPWYAFVPVLKWLQWFQMGRVRTIHIVALIPLVFIVLIPTFGPENLQLVLNAIKAVLIIQILIYLLFYWYKAAAVITVRAGERNSHSLWFLFPGLNIFILGRLAFKKTFWVASEKEKSLIDKINNGINGDHKLTTLKKYASNKGFSKNDFELVADKAMAVKNEDLKVITNEAHWVHWVNYLAAVIFFIIVSWLTFAVLSNFSVIFSRSEPKETESKQTVEIPSKNIEIQPTEPEEPLEPVNKTPPESYVFVMEIASVMASEEAVKVEGSIQKGGAISREAQRFYVLDKNFELLDSVKVNSVTGLFGQFEVTLAPFAQAQQAAYLAETKALRDQNALIAKDGAERLNQSLMIITDHDDADAAQNRELIVNLKRDTLFKEDILNVFDEDFNLINSAEIIYLLNPQKTSVEALAPVDQVELVLEFDEPYTSRGVYLSPQTQLEPLAEYLNLLGL